MAVKVRLSKNMSWTKTQYHEEICAQTGDFNEAEYWASFEPEPDEPVYESDWLLDHTGYQEFRCSLCDWFGTNERGHPECHDREQAWADR